MPLDECKQTGKWFCGANRSAVYDAYRDGKPQCANDGDCAFWADYWSYSGEKTPSRCGFDRDTNEHYCIAEEECIKNFYCGKKSNKIWALVSFLYIILFPVGVYIIYLMIKLFQRYRKIRTHSNKRNHLIEEFD